MRIYDPNKLNPNSSISLLLNATHVANAMHPYLKGHVLTDTSLNIVLIFCLVSTHAGKLGCMEL